MKMNKKGFTIVELVIVIAVIAILAGVMIPTFGGVIDSANKSAAQQTAKSVRDNIITTDALAATPVGFANADITVGVTKGGETYYFHTVDGVTTDNKSEPEMTGDDAFTKYTGTSVGSYTIPADVTVYYRLKNAS